MALNKFLCVIKSQLCRTQLFSCVMLTVVQNTFLNVSVNLIILMLVNIIGLMDSVNKYC